MLLKFDVQARTSIISAMHVLSTELSASFSHRDKTAKALGPKVPRSLRRLSLKRPWYARGETPGPVSVAGSRAKAMNPLNFFGTVCADREACLDQETPRWHGLGFPVSAATPVPVLGVSEIVVLNTADNNGANRMTRPSSARRRRVFLPPRPFLHRSFLMSI